MQSRICVVFRLQGLGFRVQVSGLCARVLHGHLSFRDWGSGYNFGWLSQVRLYSSDEAPKSRIKVSLIDVEKYGAPILNATPLNTF